MIESGPPGQVAAAGESSEDGAGATCSRESSTLGARLAAIAASGFVNLTIRRKLMVLSLTASSVALVLASAAFLSYQAVLERRAELARLSMVATVTASNTTAALSFGDEASARATLEALRAINSIRSGCVYRADGELFAAYAPGGDRGACAPVESQAGGSVAEHDTTVLRAPVVLGQETLGSVVIRARTVTFWRRLVDYAGIVAVVLAACGLLAFAISSWLQRFISEPILRLADTARRVSAEKDYSIRASGGGHDEVGLLLTAFNEMLVQIQERDRELEAFSYSVSHDLRAPLRGMDGLAAILIDDYGERLDATAMDCLERIRAAAKRMDRLVADMLVLARATRLPMRMEIVDLSALADDIGAELRAREPDRCVELVIEPGVSAIADGGLARAALRNLMENAWKFTVARPVARVRFGQRHEGGQRVYYLSDNGVGFDMTRAQKLFAPFERLHSATEYAGTGIGLATVQRIARRHGGDAWCSAAVDEGATFCFTLGPTR
ncbi:MAG: HAMP domain-containing protein [Deltaproteobacteria bacterium]|nr:HAMP domain-containing protein [Deltaproteobacteria bacterium]